MLVIVNPAAGGGTALARWRALAPLVRRHAGTPVRAVAVEAGRVRDLVRAALARGETRFVAAGGDGTVNLVASALVDQATLGADDAIAAARPHGGTAGGSLPVRPRLGAVGLGSSNDFHKPARAHREIDGTPVRLDFDAAAPHDVGLLVYTDQGGARNRRLWLSNASVGITAEANRFFNGSDRLLRSLKRLASSAAMSYAAVRGIAGYRARSMTMAIDCAPPLSVRVANLGIVKNPHFTGALRYDSPYEPGSGAFHVHLLDDGRLVPLAIALWQLSRGRFMRSGTGRSWRARWLTVRGDEPFAVECDGEVVTAREAWFSLLPRQIEVCT